MRTGMTAEIEPSEESADHAGQAEIGFLDCLKSPLGTGAVMYLIRQDDYLYRAAEIPLLCDLIAYSLLCQAK